MSSISTSCQIHSSPTGEENIFSAIKAENHKALEYFIENGDINAINPHGNTPLHVARLYGKKDTYQRLIAAGAKQDIRNFEGELASEVSTPDKEGRWSPIKREAKSGNIDDMAKTEAITEEETSSCCCPYFLSFWQSSKTTPANGTPAEKSALLGSQPPPQYVVNGREFPLGESTLSRKLPQLQVDEPHGSNQQMSSTVQHKSRPN